MHSSNYILITLHTTHTVKNLPAMQETGSRPCVGKILWRSSGVFLLGEFHGQRSLAGYSLVRGCKESTSESDRHLDTSTLHTDT